MSEKDQIELPPLNLDWNERRTERLLKKVHSRLEERRRARRALAFFAISPIALYACFAVVMLVADRFSMGARSSNGAPPQHPERNASYLSDGSKILVDRSTSEVRVIEQSAARVQVDAVRGTSRYDVVPNPARTFEVRSGAVTVTVVGTEFIVEQRGEATWVEVLRGKVRVAWGEEQAFLVAGESGIFPRESAPSATEEGLTAPGEIDPPTARGPHASQMYRARVAKRDYRGAYAVLSRNPALAGDTVEELLVAADVARLSDHPAEAVPYLQRVLREHPRDERAPLAAFTLGRTLGGLGRTEEAMNMFGRVHNTWPKSPLAEDALLRQAEAASQLGDLGATRRIAEQYDRDYPTGRRRAEVRRLARLP
jgi:transmembrane sensor